VLRFGDVEMDRVAHRVTQAGHEVELTATEFSLLESLLRRGGERVCSRTELLREVWPENFGTSPNGVNTNIVEVYVNYLRKKLGRGFGAMRAGGSCGIRTVRGEGYVLDAGNATALCSRVEALQGMAMKAEVQEA
jgi:two-component system OmpR family response regulator